MVYKPAKPAAADLLSISQADIQVNFADANTFFAVNHVAFDNTTADKGKHKSLIMKLPTALTPPEAAIPVTIADEGALYIHDTGAGTDHLRYRRESAGVVYPITESIGGYARVSAAGAVSSAFNIPNAMKVGSSYRFTFTNPLTSANYAIIVCSLVNSVFTISNILATGFWVDFTVDTEFSVLIYGEIA